MTVVALYIIEAEQKAEASLQVAKNCKTELPDDSIAAKMSDNVQVAGQDLINALGTKTQKEETKAIRNWDVMRDHGFRGVISITTGYSLLDDNPPLRDQALRMLTELKAESVTAIVDAPDLAESALLKEKIAWLRAPERKEAIEQMHLEPFVKFLENSQSNFDRAYSDRFGARKVKKGPILNYEKVLDKKLRALIGYLDADYDESTLKVVLAPLFAAQTAARAEITRSMPASDQTPPASTT